MTDTVPLSDEVLALMRNAAQKAIESGAPFLSPRAILLAMLDDPFIGPTLGAAVNREKVRGAQDSGTDALRAADDIFPDGEAVPIARYDTLAFKTPDGRANVWLNREALQIFVEGAHRAQDRYVPKDLALGVAAQAVHAPSVLSAIGVEPGVLTEAIYKL